jgi:hypothetical protein
LAAIREGVRILVGGWVVLLASACGGGDGPTAPGGNGGNGGGNGGNGDIAGAYDLINLGGRVSLPIDLQIEACPMVRFMGGGLKLYGDGTWEMAVELQDENGPQKLSDQGNYEQEGTDLWFESADYGDSFEGSVDGTVVKFDYDYCPNGETDIQFWFQR